MANDETPAGFLSRWSRRKAEVRHGVALDEVSEKSLVPSTRLVGSPDQEDGQTPNLNSAAQQKPAP